MRKINVPLCARAKAQLYIAVRAPPTWSLPVGDGAKRTRTSVFAVCEFILGYLSMYVYQAVICIIARRRSVRA